MADTSLTWLQKHERIVICALILVVILIVTNYYFDFAGKQADARLQTANQTLQVQKEANDKLAAQNQQAATQYQVLIGQVNAQNARLSGEILQLSQTLAARQKQDSSLPLPDLALRHQALLGVSAGVSSTENGFLVSSPVETQTVQQLESLPVIKQQLSDETLLADNKDKALDSSESLVVGLNQQVSGLQVQITDGQKACDARVAVVKKSRWRYFKAGLITGFLGGLYVGHKIP